MNIGIIEKHALARYVRARLADCGHKLGPTMVRQNSGLNPEHINAGGICVRIVAELPRDIEHMIDCAGRGALLQYGAAILRRGIDMPTVSIGASVDELLFQDLIEPCHDGN